MKLRRPGKKTMLLVAAMAVAGGGGFGAAKYFGIDRGGMLAWLPLDAAKQYMSVLGLAEEADPHKSEAQSHNASPNEDKPAETDHAADAGGHAGDEHAEAAENSENKNSGHAKHAEPDIPYVAPAAVQSPLVRDVRFLQSVQERLAQGDKEAARDQREVLVKLGGLVSESPAEKASLPEIYASVTYLLSGGRPDIVERFLQRKDLPQATHKLIAGAAAYVRGEAASASDQLRDLDPRQFGPSIAGHLALIQATAVEDLTAQRRRELLEFTANTLLGTLLEEAALRRLMELAAGSKDIETFVRSAHRYSRRFPNSLYNAEYRSSLLQGIISLETAKHGLSAGQLDSLIFGKSAERRNDILGSIAQASLRGGLSNLCRYAASRQRRLSPEGSALWTRAALYDASCSVADGGIHAVASLKSLNAALLSREDKELLHSALRLAEHAALADKPATAPDLQSPAKDILTDDQVIFLERIRGGLALVDEVVEKASQ